MLTTLPGPRLWIKRWFYSHGCAPVEDRNRREAAEARAAAAAIRPHKSSLEPSLDTTWDSHFHLQVPLLESGSGLMGVEAAEERRPSME